MVPVTKPASAITGFKGCTIKLACSLSPQAGCASRTGTRASVASTAAWMRSRSAWSLKPIVTSAPKEYTSTRRAVAASTPLALHEHPHQLLVTSLLGLRLPPAHMPFSSLIVSPNPTSHALLHLPSATSVKLREQCVRFTQARLHAQDALKKPCLPSPACMASKQAPARTGSRTAAPPPGR